jgi:hypothetical protein
MDDILDLATRHKAAMYKAFAEASRERKADLAVHGLTFRKGKQIESLAAGVNPKQVAEAEAKSALAGVPTKFTKDGKPIFTSWKHRDKYLKAKGWVVYDKE